MYPTVFRIGDFPVSSFGLMIFLSFLVGAWILAAQLRRRGLDPNLAWDLLVWIAFGGILGAKVYFLALHWQDVVANPIGSIFSRGGFVWYGGLIGGVAAYYWQVRRRGLPMAAMFDASAPALAIAYAVGRVGCFLVGDDYGLPTDHWIGVAFPEGSPPSTAGYLRSVGAEIPLDVPDSQVLAVHPTQLYETGAALVMFAILWKLSGRRLAPGRLFGVYLALYGIERFLIEFIRAKSDRIVVGLSTSQVASLLLLVIAAVLWLRTAQRQASAAAAPLPAGQRQGSG